MKIYSATMCGVNPVIVEIEIDLSEGLPFFQIVGLPDEVLKESKTRVKSAILQAGFRFPYDQRVVLNLAPSQLKKEGSAFELALSAKIIFESHQGVKPPFENILMLGELGLDGSVKSVDELSSLIYSVFVNKIKPDLIVIPYIEELNISRALPAPVVNIQNLNNLVNPNWWDKTLHLDCSANKKIKLNSFFDFSVSSSWAEHLKIASISRHHYLLCGPPGCGKTFFAETLKQIKQELSGNKRELTVEALDLYFNRSTGELPWASPHHTTSPVGLVGGANPPKPGAITKAHGGILFLDEFLEFSPKVLDSLREPIERGSIEIAKGGKCVIYPSHFQLIAATNPCRCGFWKHPHQRCFCSLNSRKKYQQKLSGPLMDRFDIKMFCKPLLGSERKVSAKKLVSEIQKIINFKNEFIEIDFNFDIDSFLAQSKIKSMRQFFKIKALSKSIAYCHLSKDIKLEHVEKALEYQSLGELLD